MRKLFLFTLLCSSCAKSLPAPEPTPTSRARPSWVDQVPQHVDAIAACLDLREAPRYVAFVEPLPSGATGVTTVDAYEAVEHCAYLDGRIVRRQPADFRVRDVGDAGGVLFAFGESQPVLPPDQALEEVLDRGRRLGWVFWPEAASGEEAQVP